MSEQFRVYFRKAAQVKAEYESRMPKFIKLLLKFVEVSNM